MRGIAGGNPAALADAENVPDEGDYPYLISAGQEIPWGQSDSGDGWPALAQMRLGWILFDPSFSTGFA